MVTPVVYCLDRKREEDLKESEMYLKGNGERRSSTTATTEELERLT